VKESVFLPEDFTFAPVAEGWATVGPVPSGWGERVGVEEESALPGAGPAAMFCAPRSQPLPLSNPWPSNHVQFVELTS
jgi:hypothetical protein